MTIFKKAERKQSKLRLAICAPSGAGKTYSALLLAKGLGGKVALCDTENGSGELYSNLFDYDVAKISGTFEVEKYIKVIKEAEKAGYSTLIIDSLSHAWEGEGGILDQQTKATQASRSKNSYTAWKDVTPMHNSLISAILQSSMHIICTMRSKIAYEIQDSGSGRKSPTKIGLAPVQRQGVEYEFTVILDVAMDGHIASASKDRTSLFDKRNFVITEEIGQELSSWLNSGVSEDEQIDSVIEKIKGSKNEDELRLNFRDGISNFKSHFRINDIIKAKDETKLTLEEKGE